MLSSTKVLHLVLFAMLMAIGQLLFKRASRLLGESGERNAALQLLMSADFIAAVALYVVATALWVWILRDVMLSRAYAFAALSFVFVPALSWYFLGERINWSYGAGLAFLITGLLLISKS